MDFPFVTGFLALVVCGFFLFQTPQCSVVWKARSKQKRTILLLQCLPSLSHSLASLSQFDWNNFFPLIFLCNLPNTNISLSSTNSRNILPFIFFHFCWHSYTSPVSTHSFYCILYFVIWMAFIKFLRSFLPPTTCPSPHAPIPVSKLWNLIPDKQNHNVRHVSH